MGSLWRRRWPESQQRLRIRTVLLIGLGALVVYFLIERPFSKNFLSKGQPALSFELPSSTGLVSLSDYRGRVVLLNFWASWCPPCVAEMPSLDRLHQDLQGADFAVLAVSEDEGGWADVDRFRRRMPLRLTVLLDPNGRVADKYGVSRLPQTYLIDKQGKVVRLYEGPVDWSDPNVVSEILKYVKNPE